MPTAVPTPPDHDPIMCNLSGNRINKRKKEKKKKKE
jgi:hypothetical protein